MAASLPPKFVLLLLIGASLFAVPQSHLLVAAAKLFHPLGKVGEQGADNGRGHLGHADTKVPLGEHGLLHQFIGPAERMLACVNK